MQIKIEVTKTRFIFMVVVFFGLIGLALVMANHLPTNPPPITNPGHSAGEISAGTMVGPLVVAASSDANAKFAFWNTGVSPIQEWEWQAMDNGNYRLNSISGGGNNPSIIQTTPSGINRLEFSDGSVQTSASYGSSSCLISKTGVSGGIQIAVCPAGYLMSSGGGNCGPTAGIQHSCPGDSTGCYQQGTAGTFGPPLPSTGWRIQCISGGIAQAYAICCPT